MAGLDGKVAVITGATGGIGRAASRLFAEEGARVALVDLDEGALRELAQSIGEERASYSAADVTDAAQSQAYIDARGEPLGRHRHPSGQRGHRGYPGHHTRLSC